jgi:hypothetical protein
MPLWAFILLMVVLVLLVAAAVVIPVVLIVLPRMRDNKNATSNPTAGGQSTACSADITCQNGGVAIVSPDTSCNCLCTNGFTGSTCTISSGSGCTTQDVDGMKSATLGNALPRLFDSAQANFSISLDGSLILSLFSSSNLSCTSENALVTFNGLSSRSVDVNLPIIDAFDLPSALSASPPTITPHPRSRQLHARQAVASSVSGALYLGSATADAASTRTRASAPTATATLATDNNSTTLDFARVGVLVVLQESQKMDAAVMAQENLQTFFDGSNDDNPSSVNLGSNFSIDLINLSITLSNGTLIGSTTGNATKTR